ncbi:hypothetical protein EIP86_011209 [Pleurotus ostreatoroseus]|nr:hypothetical protein EIP86_011209 [Pleurotus ostreatoroseus]
MFSPSFFLSILLTLALSSSTQAQGDLPTVPATECSTPPVQCCFTVTFATNPTTAEVLQGLDITPEHPDELVGLACSPVNGTIGPDGDASCPTNAQPLCCGQTNRE